jgi:hypothetical protein
VGAVSQKPQEEEEAGLKYDEQSKLTLSRLFFSRPRGCNSLSSSILAVETLSAALYNGVVLSGDQQQRRREKSRNG